MPSNTFYRRFSWKETNTGKRITIAPLLVTHLIFKTLVIFKENSMQSNQYLNIQEKLSSNISNQNATFPSIYHAPVIANPIRNKINRD